MSAKSNEPNPIVIRVLRISQWTWLVSGFLIAWFGYLGGDHLLTGIGAVLGGLGLLDGVVAEILIHAVSLGGRVRDGGEGFTGWKAVFSGLMTFLLGLSALFVGIIMVGERGGNSLVYLQDHPGWALIFGGLLCAVFGDHLFRESRENTPDSAAPRFAGSPFRQVAGGLLLAAGLTGLILGAADLLFGGPG